MLLPPGRIIFLKARRIRELLTITFICILTYTIFVHWSPILNKAVEQNDNVFKRRLLPHESFIKKEIVGRPNLAKYIHLDLKGAPPKADKFYESFFQFLSKLQMGIKGVIMEYEDTLPLQGNLINITHRAGYTRSDIKLIEESAKKHQLEIIPLVQTFGHLEWILKLNEYQSLRDNEQLPNVISPCLNTTYILLEDLLQQTLDMHPNSNIIHIGCDEVALTHSNSHCQRTRMSTYERYINHIHHVVLIVRKIRPGIRILIWDDILRNERSITNQNLLDPLKGLVEPVSWNYFTEFNQQYQSSSAWNIYPKFFNNMWAASAFKGGLNRFSMSTDTEHHVKNNLQWLYFMQSSTFSKDYFSAIILTGWSRFDHFMPLCDLLPTAYPALLYSLYALNTNQIVDNEQIHDCDQVLRLIGKDSQLCELLPGVSIWTGVSLLSNLLPKIHEHLKLLHTIAPEYNQKYSFVRRIDLHGYLLTLKSLKRELIAIKQSLNRHLSDLYSEDVVMEWFDLYLTPIESQINSTITGFSPALEKIIWPRRPFH